MKPIPVLVVLVASVLIVGCISNPPLRPPEVTVTGIAVTGLSLQSMDLEVSVLVDNPNPIGMTIRTVEMNVSYAGSEGDVPLGSGSTGAITVPESNQTEFVVPITVDNPAVLAAATTLLLSGELEVKAKGTATIDVGTASFKVPFTKTERLAMPALIRTGLGAGG